MILNTSKISKISKINQSYLNMKINGNDKQK